jgi:hypothetical protein
VLLSATPTLQDVIVNGSPDCLLALRSVLQTPGDKIKFLKTDEFPGGGRQVHVGITGSQKKSRGAGANTRCKAVQGL